LPGEDSTRITVKVEVTDPGVMAVTDPDGAIAYSNSEVAYGAISVPKR
jgi:hypothetical protein